MASTMIAIEVAQLTCSLDGCDRPVRVLSRGWCNRHYQRWLKHGDPHGGHVLSPEERFWARVSFDGPVPITRPELGPCHPWKGRIRADGYGDFRLGRNGRFWKPHRYAWLLSGRTIPNGYQLDHLCHSVDAALCLRGSDCPHRRCVNVDHLEVVTAHVNILRGNGPTAQNALKTHCPQGHSLSGENLYVIPSSGWRVCRTCKREHRHPWPAVT